MIFRFINVSDLAAAAAAAATLYRKKDLYVLFSLVQRGFT